MASRAERRCPGCMSRGIAFLVSVEARRNFSADPRTDAPAVTSARRQNGLDSETIAVKPFGRVSVPNSFMMRPSSR